MDTETELALNTLDAAARRASLSYDDHLRWITAWKHIRDRLKELEVLAGKNQTVPFPIADSKKRPPEE